MPTTTISRSERRNLAVGQYPNGDQRSLFVRHARAVATLRAGGASGTDGTEDAMGGTAHRHTRPAAGTLTRTRRWAVTLFAASVLSVPFATQAASAETAGTAEANPPVCTTTTSPVADGTTTSSTTAAATSIPPQEPASTTSTTTSTPSDGSCPDGRDTGGAPRGHDDCDDTGGAPSGSVPKCRAEATLGDPDARLADCAGDIDHPTCGELVTALVNTCAGADWPAACRSNADGMLQICTDGDAWAADACKRAQSTLGRFCREVVDADPERCAALLARQPATPESAPAGTPGRSTVNEPPRDDRPAPQPGQGGGAAADSADLLATGSPGSVPPPPNPATGRRTGDPRGSGAAVQISQAVNSQETTSSDDTPEPTPSEAAVETTRVENVVSTTPTVVQGWAPTETFAPRPATISAFTAAQRRHDRWSLVPLALALALVIVSSAYDLRGRRRW